jgi:hypothetical protein
MQVILKSDRYNTIGTARREYPLNTPIEMDAEELKQVREALKDVPNLQIMERPAAFSKEDMDRVASIIAGLKGKHVEAQEELLQKGFEELPAHLRQELKVQAVTSLSVAPDVKRNVDRLLETATIWDRVS